MEALALPELRYRNSKIRPEKKTTVVKDLYLHPEMFSVSNGLLTPTLKSKRVDLRRLFSEQMAQMYSKSSI
ncbi:long-chain-fatty-acid--CoA ligase 1 isoform a [Pimephales promelas]|nr:long-chain-fatty-acid--CoA ligase 1 isoform a [Pimephales promelas]